MVPGCHTLDMMPGNDTVGITLQPWSMLIKNSGAVVIDFRDEFISDMVCAAACSQIFGLNLGSCFTFRSEFEGLLVLQMQALKSMSVI